MSHDKGNDRWVMVNFGLLLELLNRIFDAIEINWKNHLARFFFEKWFHEMLKIRFRKQPDNTRVPKGIRFWNSYQSAKTSMDPYWRILNRGVSFGWSFSPLSAWRSIGSTTIPTTHPSLENLSRFFSEILAFLVMSRSPFYWKIIQILFFDRTLCFEWVLQ